MQPWTIKPNLPHPTFFLKHHLLSPAILSRALLFSISIPKCFGDPPSSVPSVSGHCLIPSCLMLWVLAGFLGLGAVQWWKASCQGGNISGQREAEAAPSTRRNKATFLGFYSVMDPPQLLTWPMILARAVTAHHWIQIPLEVWRQTTRGAELTTSGWSERFFGKQGTCSHTESLHESISFGRKGEEEPVQMWHLAPQRATGGMMAAAPRNMQGRVLLREGKRKVREETPCLGCGKERLRQGCSREQEQGEDGEI